MPETFFISDTHFGHANMLKFTDNRGIPIRTGFANVDDMNETIIQRWNKIVGHQDRVIHCGDVAFGKEALQMCHRLKGIKHLVLGNHDNMDIQAYAKIFSKIFGAKYIGGDIAICTHIPIHEGSLRGFGLNIHGHLHERRIFDRRYFNVSCEQINYTPISLDDILKVTKNKEE